MTSVNATLPVIGNTTVHFYEKSEKILKFSRINELNRLDRIPHLGLAKVAFTGLNHSRLEYTLLQCAIVEIASKLHKDDPDIALSNDVTLDGNISKADSGEDLVKAWFLLSAFGHCQWTFGTERALLQKAYQDKDFERWILSDFRLHDLKNWARGIIKNYNHSLFHYVLTIRRITLGEKYNRDKTKLLHYLRNFVLDPTDLFDSVDKRVKIRDLQSYFEKIRLLSIVSLDSHYSHTPIDINIQSAISNPNTFKKSGIYEDHFGDKMELIAGMLADNLYLHKKVTAIQRYYEVDKYDSISSQFSNNKGLRPLERQVMENWLRQGLGDPTRAQLVPLIRLTFDDPATPLLGSQNQFDSMKMLEEEIGSPPEIRVSLERNPWTGSAHIDVFFERSVTAREVGKVYCRIQRWLLRSLKAEAQRRVRDLAAVAGDNDDVVERIKKDHLRGLINSERHVLSQIVDSVLNYLIPDEYKFTTLYFEGKDEYKKGYQNPISINIDKGVINLDEVSDTFSSYLSDDTFDVDTDRIHEIETIRRCFLYDYNSLQIVCTDNIVISDSYGLRKDEWDGLIIGISDDNLDVTIVEAKNYGSKSRSVSESYDQLKDTVNLLHEKRNLKYRRKRVSGHGAKLEVEFEEYK